MNKIKWLRNLWILIMILLLGNSTFSQNTERIKIQITQQGLPSGISYFYSLDNSRLKVFKITKTNKILKCYKYLNKYSLTLLFITQLKSLTKIMIPYILEEP